jgi:hypothetical protein
MSTNQGYINIHDRGRFNAQIHRAIGYPDNGLEAKRQQAMLTLEQWANYLQPKPKQWPALMVPGRTGCAIVRVL